MKRNHKTILKWVSSILASLLVVVLAAGWWLAGERIAAANSIEKLQDNLYVMEYRGDYGFDEFLKQGGAENDEEVADYLVSYLSFGLYQMESDVQMEKYGCSTISTRDEYGTVFFGRNYDWKECRTMIVHTIPEDGYESISTCNLDFLGFDENYTPDGSIMERMQTLASIYIPMDGMNEKGLIVADLMAGDDEATHQKSDKADLTTTTAIRLLLDQAADVNEAIKLLKQYDMNSSIESAHHFAIADATGKSVVVEYVDGKMIVEEAKVVTNHYLTDCDKQGVGSRQSHIRYDTLCAHNGSADETGVRDLLKSVAQNNYPQTEGSYEKTMWSIVYCPQSLCADFYFNENYEHSYGLLLQEKGSFLKQ